MSATLEMIERIAYERVITDKEVIGEVINSFLDVGFKELTGSKNYNIVLNELSNGFEFSKPAIEDLSLREILILISHEKGRGYFEIEEDDIWPDTKLEDGFCTSFSCFHLMSALVFAKARVPAVGRFMKIAPGPFTRALSCREMYPEVMNAISKYCKGVIKDAPRTLGDCLGAASAVGNAPWACGVIGLEFYAERMTQLYRIAKNILMDGLCDRLIVPDAVDFMMVYCKCECKEEEV